MTEDLRHFRAPRPLEDFATEHAGAIIIALLALAIVLDKFGVWA